MDRLIDLALRTNRVVLVKNGIPVGIVKRNYESGKKGKPQ